MSENEHIDLRIVHSAEGKETGMGYAKRRPIAIIMVLMLLFTTIFGEIGTKNVQAEESILSISKWEFTDGFGTHPFAATAGNGTLTTNGIFTQSTATKPGDGYSGGGIRFTGFNGTAGTKYWEVAVPTVGYENIQISFNSKSSGTGPKDFKGTYSIDNGNNWSNIQGAVFANNSEPLTSIKRLFTLPSDAKNCANLLLRFTSNSEKSVNNGTVSASGVLSLNNIMIDGTALIDPSTCQAVKSTPETGSQIKLGEQITLMTPTSGASVIYQVNGAAAVSGASVSIVKANTLPMTINAYAKKDGLKDSVTKTFTYSQLKVETPKASPNGGAIKLDRKIELTSLTEGAAIQYSINGGSWTAYTEGFTLPSFPSVVKAKATLAGVLDSEEATYQFTERLNDNYNLYFGQVHSHTSNSDGIGSLDDAFAYASNVPNLDFLAVTDHSNSLEDAAGTAGINDGSSSQKWQNGRAAAQKHTTDDFIGLYGYEMTWSNGTGHINTYNSNGFENRNTAKYKTTAGLSEYYKALKSAPNTISQFNHPGNTFGDFNDFANYDPTIDSLISMIEVGNGEGVVRGEGYFPSYEYYTRALDKGWHVSPTNNQDNHKGKWGDSNTTRTVIMADTLSEANIYDAMKNNRTYATEDNNLEIMYTLNDEPMGTIFSEKPSSAEIKVDLKDSDNEGIGKVEVIVNGGLSIASKSVADSASTVTFTVPTDYSYYYIRVSQPDKDIAVTAPVWIGEVDKAGIGSTKTDAALPIRGEQIHITSNIYNNENVPMKIESLKYSIDETQIHTADLTGKDTVNALTSLDYGFDYTSSNAGSYNIDVTLTATINGAQRIYKDVMKVNFTDPSIVTKVVIDGSHNNDYVNGYYAGNMGNFTTIAAREQVQVKIETEITPKKLADASLLVISAPAKKSGTVGDIAYQPVEFSEEFLNIVKDYVDHGGNLILCGIADYQDGTANYQTSIQLNRLLEKIGATSRVLSDEVVDYDNNTSGNVTTNISTAIRLAFTDVNIQSPLLKDFIKGQKYSFYSGCSIKLDDAAVAAGTADWLVKGHDTTYSIDSKPVPSSDPVVQKGEVNALVSEKLSGGGTMLVGGTVFISNFEVKAEMDNYNDLQFTNYTIAKNMLDMIKKPLTVKTIAEARKGNKGDVFTVEGTITAGTEIEENKFFDTVYIQDATGGMNIFPVSTDGIKVGQKVRVTGSVDEYQGDLELRVIGFEVLGDSVNPISPKQVTTAQAADYGNFGGQLVKVQGTVTKAVQENGVLSYAMVKDGSGTPIRVFTDGYIGYSNPSSAKLETFVKEGAVISAVGLVSYDPEGTRIRVRDRSEVMIPGTSDNTGSSGNTGGSSGTASNGMIHSKNESAIISAIDKQLENADKLPVGQKAQVIIDVSSSDKIKVSVLSAAKDKDIDLIFVSEKDKLVLNGKQLGSIIDSKAEIIELAFQKITNETTTKLLKNLAQGKEISMIQIDEKVANANPVYINTAGKNYAGRTLYLNYLQGNKLVQIDKAIADKDGVVTFKVGTKPVVKTFALDTNAIQKASYVVTLESVAEEEAEVIAPKLSKKSTSLAVGKTYKIKVSNVTEDRVVAYKSSNKKVATVTKAGTIKGVKSGKTTITTTVIQNDRVYTLKTTVTVTAKSPKLSKSKITLQKGKTYKVKLNNLDPKKTITYKTSNKKIATVTKTGTIKGIKAGNAAITATVKQNGKTYTLKTVVTVKGPAKK